MRHQTRSKYFEIEYIIELETISNFAAERVLNTDESFLIDWQSKPFLYIKIYILCIYEYEDQ